MTKVAPIADRQDEGAARVFIGGMFVYAILMICLFSLPRTGLAPDLFVLTGLN